MLIDARGGFFRNFLVGSSAWWRPAANEPRFPSLPEHTRAKIEVVRYWVLLFTLMLPSAATFADDVTGVALRGHLRQTPGIAPAIETADHKKVVLQGDEPTMKVLNDARLKDSDFEVLGHFGANGAFEVNHIHLPSLFVYRNGKRLQVSYWCDVCYIRTSSPGKCWCCQKETDLDPVPPEQ